MKSGTKVKNKMAKIIAKSRFIPVSEPNIGREEKKNVLECLNSTWISSLGKFIPEFEKEFTKFCGVKHGIATSNGTTALHLALLTMGIKEGDEVIIPNHTFIASANVVRHCRAEPVFVDCDPETYNIDPKEIEKRITKKTKAIMAVHLFGHPCEMDKIMNIAKKHKLFLIEDCAQAHGAEFKGKKVGSFGDIGCFSFYGNKIITTGEGGMCITNNRKLAEKMQYLRDHHMSKRKRFWHDEVGYNYRMTNLQAAIGVAQMKKINKFIAKRRKNAALYNKHLKNVKGIRLPVEKKGCKNVYWAYGILLDKNFGMSRDKLASELRKKGIDSRPFFYLMTDMPPYKSNEKFSVGKDISRNGICLPSSSMTKESDIKYICDTIKKLAK